MGGSGSLSSREIEGLERIAREKLQESKADGKAHVFISFAHEDEREINLLRGQAKNEDTSLEFDDYSLKAPINSKMADYVKGRIREKIERASVTLVFLSAHSARSQWVNWEIEESLRQGKGVIGMYGGAQVPSELPAAFKTAGCDAVPWSHKEISAAIQRERERRS